jgi:hypothetical protein
MRPTKPTRDEITQDTPLRLSVAAAIAFPDGSMTASGLRRESFRGRLVIERIAGKDFTTLGNIEQMRQSCRVEAKAHVCGSSRPGTMQKASVFAGQSTLSGTERPSEALASAKAKLKKLKERSPNT